MRGIRGTVGVARNGLKANVEGWIGHDFCMVPTGVAAPSCRGNGSIPAGFQGRQSSMRILLTSTLCLGLASRGLAQTVTVTAADYDRARGLQAKNRALVVDAIEAPTWAGNTRLLYRKSVEGGNAFMLVDVTDRQAPVKRAAFDHERLASGLGAVTGARYTAVTLPFTSYTFANNDQAITFTVDTTSFTCSLAEYTCARTTAGAGAGRGGRGGGGGGGIVAADLPSPDGKRIAYINNYNV